MHQRFMGPEVSRPKKRGTDVNTVARPPCECLWPNERR
jgi:hypothetical protein